MFVLNVHPFLRVCYVLMCACVLLFLSCDPVYCLYMLLGDKWSVSTCPYVYLRFCVLVFVCSFVHPCPNVYMYSCASVFYCLYVSLRACVLMYVSKLVGMSVFLMNFCAPT